MSDPSRPPDALAGGLSVARGSAREWYGRDWALRAGSVVTVLVLWHLASLTTSQIFLPGPLQVGSAFVRLLLNGRLVTQVLVSAQSLLLGFSAAILLGTLLGLAIGRWHAAETTVEPYMVALYATPIVGLVPLFIIWFGIGFSARVAIVLLSSLFPVAINTQLGVKQIDRSLLDLARLYQASERQIFTKLIVPFSVPYILAGVRIAVGRAIIGEIVAEQLMNLVGLGFLMLASANEFDTASVIAVTGVLMTVGIGASSAIKVAESRLAPWRAGLEVR